MMHYIPPQLQSCTLGAVWSPPTNGVFTLAFSCKSPLILYFTLHAGTRTLLIPKSCPLPINSAFIRKYTVYRHQMESKARWVFCFVMNLAQRNWCEPTSEPLRHSLARDLKMKKNGVSNHFHLILKHLPTHTSTTVVNLEPKASMLGLYALITSLNCGLFTWTSMMTLLCCWNSITTLQLCGFHTFTLVFSSITDPLIWSASSSLKMYRERKATVPSVQGVSFWSYLNEWCINAAHVSWSVHNSFINTNRSGKRKLF